MRRTSHTNYGIGFRQLLPGLEVTTVPDAGWAGVLNGELLRRAAGQFDAFVTCDQSVPHQQNLAAFELRIVILAGPSNKFGDLEPLAPQVVAVGQLRVVS